MLRHIRISSSRDLRSTTSIFARCFSQQTPLSANEPGWEGRPADEHVANRRDELDVHNAAAKDGQRDRASGSKGGSQAVTEKDAGKNNERAKKDHPEAPDVVIGMNDERGGKGH